MQELKKNLRVEVWGSDMDRYALQHPLVEIDNVLVDAHALFGSQAACELCGTCCAGGTSIPAKTAEKLAPHLQEIAEMYIPEERRNALGWRHESPSRRGLHKTNIVRIGAKKKGCCFLYKDGERYLCSIYAWAEKTNKDLYEYWPFECIMYPLAVLPYNGILHPGKLLVTLRMPENWKLVDVYGSFRRTGSVLGNAVREIKALVRQFFEKWGFNTFVEPPPILCYFNASQLPKQASYIYFGQQLRWYFGDEFYQKVAEAAERYKKQFSEPIPAIPGRS